MRMITANSQSTEVRWRRLHAPKAIVAFAAVMVVCIVIRGNMFWPVVGGLGFAVATGLILGSFHRFAAPRGHKQVALSYDAHGFTYPSSSLTPISWIDVREVKVDGVASQNVVVRYVTDRPGTGVAKPSVASEQQVVLQTPAMHITASDLITQMNELRYSAALT